MLNNVIHNNTFFYFLFHFSLSFSTIQTIHKIMFVNVVVTVQYTYVPVHGVIILTSVSYKGVARGVLGCP